ncbi:MAG: hypothetical protein COS94_04350 [Candidatus Hydrogenedentes bacterium CG07_land_8_20_14_0_80_42_17]|nr:MAG: hypothetical protein COS94_04350 [Candidatus Hydrogenedentes bacterium CG07_land_8_20_14_0_80_42_17]
MIFYNLNKCLSGLSRENLSIIADKLGISIGRDMIPAIESNLRRDEFANSIIKKMPEETLDILEKILKIYDWFKQNDRYFISSEKTIPLFEHGILFLGQEELSDPHIVMPIELEQSIRLAVRERILQRIRISKTSENIFTGSDKFIRNATTITMLVHNNPIPLTKTNQFMKKYVQKNILPFLEQYNLNKNEKDNEYLILNIIFDFMFTFRILEKKENKIILGATWKSWLEADRETIRRSLFEFSYYYFNSDFNLNELIKLFKMCKNNWLYSDDIIRELFPYDKKHSYYENFANAHNHLFDFLSILGILMSGKANGEKVIATGLMFDFEKRLSDGADHFTVTPDFKIIAPRELAPRIRQKLSIVAEYVKSDMMDQWAITKESICCAIDQGMNESDIINFLNSNCNVSLPANVNKSICLWIEEHMTIQFFNGPVLIVEKSSRELEKIKSILNAESAIILMPAENVFLLKSEKCEKVINKIKINRSFQKIQSFQKTSKFDKEFEVVINDFQKRESVLKELNNNISRFVKILPFKK